MIICRLASMSRLLAIAGNSWILKRTSITEPYVLLIALLVLAATLLLVKYAPSPKLMLRGLAVLSLSSLAGLVLLGFWDLRVLDLICEEDHVIEWLTAAFLLAGWVLGLILTIRLIYRKTPSPLVAFLTGGYFWGFWRELEFGRPFFGEKLIYTRNFFRLGAYSGPEYFEQFEKSLGHQQLRPLFEMHWIAVTVALTCAVLLLVHLYRHRRVFPAELRELPRTAHGLLFLWGLGIYLGSQLAGELFDVLLGRGFFPHYRQMFGFSHRIIAEPLECVASLCFLISIIALWNTIKLRVDNATC